MLQNLFLDFQKVAFDNMPFGVFIVPLTMGASLDASGVWVNDVRVSSISVVVPFPFLLHPRNRFVLQLFCRMLGFSKNELLDVMRTRTSSITYEQAGFPSRAGRYASLIVLFRDHDHAVCSIHPRCARRCWPKSLPASIRKRPSSPLICYFNIKQVRGVVNLFSVVVSYCPVPTHVRPSCPHRGDEKFHVRERCSYSHDYIRAGNCNVDQSTLGLTES